MKSEARTSILPALRIGLAALAACALVLGCVAGAHQAQRSQDSTAVPAGSPADQLLTWQQEVAAADRAFAATMANRKLDEFASFLADDAVFLSPRSLHGKAQIVTAWKPYFGRGAAPFSWEAAHVEVLDNGTLALTSGPVRGSSGHIVGVYSSVWRRVGTDRWRVIFNVGTQTCSCAR